MGLTNSQYDAVMRDYDRRQSAARSQREERRRQVYEAVPRMEELEQQIAAASAARAREALLEVQAGSAQERLSALRAEREGLLQAAGFPADYLELQYTCGDCRDTGYVGGQKCHCFRQAVLDLLYSQSNLREVLQEENFEHFSMEYYDDVRVDRDYGVTSYENMEAVAALCRDLVERFDREHGSLLLMGDVGVGKTFLARCIAKELLDRAFSVVYLSANELFELLSRFRWEGGEEEEEQARHILDCDMLIIDDLGTELSNSLTNSKLFYCINERLLRKKGTIITTNLTQERLRDIYSERIVSRLMSKYQLCYLFGDDVRMKKRRLGIKP